MQEKDRKATGVEYGGMEEVCGGRERVYEVVALLTRHVDN